MTATCQRCGEPFDNRRGTAFCSPRCRWAAAYWSNPEAVRQRMRDYRQRIKQRKEAA